MVWLKHNTTRSGDDVGTQRQFSGLRFKQLFKIRRSKPKTAQEEPKFTPLLDTYSSADFADTCSVTQDLGCSSPGPLVVRLQRPSSQLRVRAKEIQEKLHGPQSHADSASSATDTTDTSAQSKIGSDASFTMVDDEVSTQVENDNFVKSTPTDLITEVYDSNDSNDPTEDSPASSTLGDDTSSDMVPHTIQAISEPSATTEGAAKRKSVTAAPAPRVASFHSRTFPQISEKCGPRLEPVTPLAPVISAKPTLASNRSVRSVAFEGKPPPMANPYATNSFNVPTRSPLRAGNRGPPPGVVLPGGRYRQRQSLLGDDMRSNYGPVAGSAASPQHGPPPGNEFSLPNRANSRPVRQHKNRVSSVLPQHYRAKPLSKKTHPSTMGDIDSLVFTSSPSIHPSSSNGSGSGNSGHSSKSGRPARPNKKEWERRDTSSASPVSVQGYPQYPVYAPSFEKLNKPGNRASVASSLASILPYIAQYNKLMSEDNSEPAAPQIDRGSIADTYCRTEHIEDTDAKRIEEQNREIERMLFERVPPKSARRYNTVRDDIMACAPCIESVEEYANKLDEEFGHIREVDTNPEFRERILRGTSYAPLERRPRLLDKDLPSLPSHAEDILGRRQPKAKGIDTILGKLRLLT